MQTRGSGRCRRTGSLLPLAPPRPTSSSPAQLSAAPPYRHQSLSAPAAALYSFLPSPLRVQQEDPRQLKQKECLTQSGPHPRPRKRRTTTASTSRQSARRARVGKPPATTRARRRTTMRKRSVLALCAALACMSEVGRPRSLPDEPSTSVAPRVCSRSPGC